MALPSAVTLGSLAFVVVAGVGFVAVTSSAAEDDSARRAPEVASPSTTAPPSKAPARQQHSTKPDVDRPPHRRPKPDSAVPDVFVEVYNNSGVTGLAADKASFLEGAGWSVSATDNWYGDIPSTTVYYPGRLKPQAARLAKALGVSRLRPAVSPMQFDRLTVIFTAS
ncbi:MAG: LytR C-terminal domain-containing protein [Nocardioidaceae bacterium]